MDRVKIEFFLNGEKINIEVDPQERAIDIIRERLGLLGTKEGCSDGDCGACTIVFGKLENKKMVYKAVNSCLLLASKLNKSSIITIEGLKENDKLNIIQEAMIETHGAQCGFCSPGVIMSFFGLMASEKNPTLGQMEKAIEGNICRCTGYDGIRDAAKYIISLLEKKGDLFDVVPLSIRSVEDKLKSINLRGESHDYKMPLTLDELKEDLKNSPQSMIVSGCTDVMVRKHNLLFDLDKIIDLSLLEESKIIKEVDHGLLIGANIELEKLLEDTTLISSYPIFKEMLSQMASVQVRNMATLAGNLCNASPIGDAIVLLMAMNATLVLFSCKGERRISIREFYKGYKKMDIKEGEALLYIIIPKENKSFNISYEKTGKRNAVDIASVNSASRMKIENNEIKKWEISLGGISETVVYRELKNIPLSSSIEDIEDLAEKLSKEFNPLSDVRGSSEFRTLLIQGHLVKHFLRLNGKEV